MPFLSFTTGQVLSSSDMNTMSKQSITTCTSTTRPSSPAIGTHIYETNTGNLMQYYGATTGWAKPWSVAWGTVATITLGTTAAFASPNWGFPFPWNGTGLIANRLMRATVDFAWGIGTGVGQVDFGIGTAAGTGVGRVINVYQDTGTAPRHLRHSVDFTTTAGSMTRGLTIRKNSGGGNIDVLAQSQLFIEDIGPSTTPPAS